MTNREFITAFRELMQGSRYFNRRIAILLAVKAKTSPEKVVLHAEKIGLLDTGSWDFMQRAGGSITRSMIERAIRDQKAGVPNSTWLSREE